MTEYIGGASNVENFCRFPIRRAMIFRQLEGVMLLRLSAWPESALRNGRTDKREEYFLNIAPGLPWQKTHTFVYIKRTLKPKLSGTRHETHHARRALICTGCHPQSNRIDHIAQRILARTRARR